MPTGYAGRKILVCGSDGNNFSATRALLNHGAEVLVVDLEDSERLEQIRALGATVAVAAEPSPALLRGMDDVIVQAMIRPDDPLVIAALAAGLDVYCEAELAWRLRGPGAPPWLAITGTNGKTTTAKMLTAILAADGRRTVYAGNNAKPLSSVVDYDVLVVELCSFHLHWSSRMAPQAGALLNLAEDHLGWHGGFAAYRDAKVRIWRAATPGGNGVAVANADDPAVARLRADLPGKTIDFTLGPPRRGQLGVVDEMLVDHTGELVPLIGVDEIRQPGRHNMANGLAAAALALAHGVRPEAIRMGLAGYTPAPHRNAEVATLNGVAFVDDSKATNPHAAEVSLRTYERVVWIAGGFLKGVEIAGLVANIADRLAGAVVLGINRAQFAAAIAHYAPDVPVIEVSRTDPPAMDDAVNAAMSLAHAGDTVLLAPAAASQDMFRDFAHRGEVFATAVQALATR